MKICTIYGSVSDKIKSVVFAKQIAAEAAAREERRKKTIFVVCLCAGIAIVAAGIAVGIYFLAKKEGVKEKVAEKVNAVTGKVSELTGKVTDKVGTVVSAVKSKIPCKKNVEECECECECEAPETDAE